MNQPQVEEHDASHAVALRRTALCVAAICLVMAGLGALLAWWAWRQLPAPPLKESNRFVAFSFAAMGLTWLAAVLMVGGRLDWPALFRWGVAIDCVGIALLVAAALSGAATWREGLKLYALLACFATLQLAAWFFVHRLTRRAGLAAAAAVLLAGVGCTSLLWGHLPDRLFTPTSRADTATLAVVRYVNPLLAANDAVTPPTRFDWPHFGRMYRQYGIIGESRTWPLPSWWRACLLYLAISAALFAGGIILPRSSPGAARAP